MTRSTWTHQSCNVCWSKLNPDRPFPLRMTYNGTDRVWDTCCWCGNWNNSGIFVRAEPNLPGFCTHSA